MRSFFTFPNPVNEVAARSVAAGVFVLSVTTFVLSIAVSESFLWLTLVLAIGFALRVAAGPKLSPLGQFATRVAAPAIGHAKSVPGPPKRFAQALGLTMSLVAFVLFLVGAHVAALVFVAFVIVASFLESALAFCLGCTLFAALMKAGIIPEDVCEACANWGAGANAVSSNAVS